MKKAIHRLVVSALSLLVSISTVLLAQPSCQAAPSSALTFFATPFVAADKPHNAELRSSVVAAKGSPFAIKASHDAQARGMYAGVVIEPTQAFTNLQTISFSANQPENIRVTVHSQMDGKNAFNYTWALASAGAKNDGTQGTKHIVLNSSQLHVNPDSFVDRIVISTVGDSNASSVISDLTVNGQPVTKVLAHGTRFYKVIAGHSVGPLGGPPLKSDGLPTTFTTMSLTNSTGSTRYFFMTLTPPKGYPASEVYNNVNNVSFTVSGTNHVSGSGEGKITKYPGTTGLTGFFYLNSNDTVSFSPTLTFSAAFYVNGTGKTTHGGPNDCNCITGVHDGVPVEGTGIGSTFAEVTLNVDSTYLGDEVVDISEVNGVNSLWSISLPLATTPVYPQYFDSDNYVFCSTTTTPWGTYNQGQLIPVPSIANAPGPYPFTGDRNAALSYCTCAPYGTGPMVCNGNIGVYPIGCDDCISRSKPGCPNGPHCFNPHVKYPAASKVEQTLTNCQVNRYAGYQIGGNVGIALTSFSNPGNVTSDDEADQDGGL
ncbi:MAG TPA: hypothetical protein V6C81_07345 [Planktothrix sp.]|jgi:hypothetical protein